LESASKVGSKFCGFRGGGRCGLSQQRDGKTIGLGRAARDPIKI